jgi:hypothetical protein
MNADMKNNTVTEVGDELEHSPINEIRARRNHLAGYWVGQKLGLLGGDLSAYAREAHESDYEMAGDADIIAKLTGDLKAHGVIFSNDEANELLKSCHRQSLLDSHCTD